MMSCASVYIMVVKAKQIQKNTSGYRYVLCGLMWGDRVQCSICMQNYPVTLCSYIKLWESGDGLVQLVWLFEVYFFHNTHYDFIEC